MAEEQTVAERRNREPRSAGRALALTYCNLLYTLDLVPRPTMATSLQRDFPELSHLT